MTKEEAYQVDEGTVFKMTGFGGDHRYFVISVRRGYSPLYDVFLIWVIDSRQGPLSIINYSRESLLGTANIFEVLAI